MKAIDEIKAKVITRFKDRYTKKIHRPGDILEINGKRFKEIQAVGNLLELIEEAEESKPVVESKEKKSKE